MRTEHTENILYMPEATLETVDTSLREMREILDFLKDEVATKEDLKAFATKEDLKTEIDGLESRLLSRMSGIESELRDIRASLARLEKKTQEDDDAMVSEIDNLKKRVAFLEKVFRVRQLQARS